MVGLEFRLGWGVDVLVAGGLYEAVSMSGSWLFVTVTIGDWDASSVVCMG